MALVGLEEMQSCFSRVRELMIQIQAPPNSEQNRISCFYEVEALLQECDRIANHTKNKETNLLNGEYDVNINVTNSALEIDNITLDTVENTVGQIEKLEEVIKKIFQLRKELAIKEGTYTPNEYTIDGKWADKLKIVDGKLVYIGTDEKEKKWAEQIGIQVGY